MPGWELWMGGRAPKWQEWAEGVREQLGQASGCVPTCARISISTCFLFSSRRVSESKFWLGCLLSYRVFHISNLIKKGNTHTHTQFPS